MASTAPIGVFDSGLGGISVAREIRRDMPNEHVLYFGDSANAPYGTKSPELVRELSEMKRLGMNVPDKAFSMATNEEAVAEHAAMSVSDAADLIVQLAAL